VAAARVITSEPTTHEPRRPRALELGLFVLLVALPLAFTPFTIAPFADLKIVLLAAGTLAVWFGGLKLDRKLAWLAGIWVGVTAAAALAGVQPSASLLASTSGEGGGLMLTVCAATLLIVGASLPQKQLAQARRLLGLSGLVVSVVGLAYRFDPHALMNVGGGTTPVSLIGSTMGNQIFSGTFDAAALAAVLGDEFLPRWQRVLFGVVISAGIAAAGERSSLVLPVIVLGVLIWRSGKPIRDWIMPVTLVVAVIGGWQLLNPHLPKINDQGAVGQFSSSATDRQRLTMWRVLVSASGKRPLLGWGPDASRSANLATATEQQLTDATLGYSDAHDIFLETLVTTGILGLIALIALGVIAVPRILRSTPERAWLVAIAAALGAYSLIEPLNLVLTPLLFFSIGAAAGLPTDAMGGTSRDSALPRIASLATGVLLLTTVVVAVQMLIAAGFEQQGKVYADGWAYRISLDIEPWRLTATEGLAQLLAQDGSGSSARVASSMMADAVGHNPWDTRVRLYASTVETLLNHNAAAEAYLAQQLRLFPGDVKQVIDRKNHPPGLTLSP
jgi:O-antigen ligase